MVVFSNAMVVFSRQRPGQMDPCTRTPRKCPKNVANGPEIHLATILQHIDTYPTHFEEISYFSQIIDPEITSIEGAMRGQWHIHMQNLFADAQQEVEFSFVHLSENDKVTKRRRFADVCVDEAVVEYQHSSITRKEVNGRNEDYAEKLGKTIAWVIDCTENVSSPSKISSSDDDEEVWMLEFEKKWHVESMRDCKILFAVFRDANTSWRIFRVPIESVRHRLVLAFAQWGNLEDWKTHVISGEMIDDEVNAPIQTRLTVAQDPHGSGKTYRLTRMMIHTSLPEYARFDAYSTFIVVTKPHSAKEVVFVEFITNLRDAGFEYDVQCNNNKYIVKFMKPNGTTTMCIFGTVDSLMYNLCDNKMHGPDKFVNLVRTIHKHGPTKLQGPKGRIRYAGQQPGINKKTLLITDEATMLPESYADAFSTLMVSCHVDVHLAGDVQQSTYFEHNLLTRVVREYNEAIDPCYLPSFQGCHVHIQSGNEVRRFNQALVEFRNTVMRGFHEFPSHNLSILRPVAALDVVHSRGEYSLHMIERTGAWDDPESWQVVSAIETIMDQLRRDVYESKLLPNDILVITPFVKNNPLMDELQTAVHEFWGKTFYDAEYIRLLHEKTASDTVKALETRKAKYSDTKVHFEGHFSSPPWFCVLHRSEEGKPIDTTESKYGTRIVSIHASQGDGRKFAYVVGLGENKLTRFSNGKINLKYESLLNVAVSRMKEVIRVFLEPEYDDIWVRFLPLMSANMLQSVPPSLDVKSRFKLLNVCNIDLDEALFNLIKDKVVASSPCDASGTCNRPMLDYAHHVIRMAIAHTVFWSQLIVYQTNDMDYKEQVLTLFKKVANAPIKVFSSTHYYEILRADNNPIIPVLHYNSGSAVFESLHTRTLHILGEVQDHVRRWIHGEKPDYQQVTPEHAVLLQYAIEVFTLAKFGKENIKMDHVYDVVHCYMHKTDDSNSKLERHYDYVTQLTSMFNQVKDHCAEKDWKWKIYRSISLGNKRTGNSTQYFQFQTYILDLLVTETRAMPIILCPTVDEINMASMCAQALLYTLVCVQPEEREVNGMGIPTWRYVKDKSIEVCFVPIKDSRPIFIDLTQIVEENIDALATWICKYVENESETGILQAKKIAEHFRNDLEEARELVADAHKKGKCPDHLRDAFEEADDAEEVPMLCRKKLKAHLKALSRDIQSRSDKRLNRLQY